MCSGGDSAREGSGTRLSVAACDAPGFPVPSRRHLLVRGAVRIRPWVFHDRGLFHDCGIFHDRGIRRVVVDRPHADPRASPSLRLAISGGSSMKLMVESAGKPRARRKAAPVHESFIDAAAGPGLQ